MLSLIFYCFFVQYTLYSSVKSVYQSRGIYKTIRKKFSDFYLVFGLSKSNIFISLHQPVTNNQLPFFSFCLFLLFTIQIKKKPGCLFSFLNKNQNKEISYLAFSHWLMQRNKQWSFQKRNLWANQFLPN